MRSVAPARPALGSDLPVRAGPGLRVGELGNQAVCLGNAVTIDVDRDFLLGLGRHGTCLNVVNAAAPGADRG